MNESAKENDQVTSRADLAKHQRIKEDRILLKDQTTHSCRRVLGNYMYDKHVELALTAATGGVMVMGHPSWLMAQAVK